MPHSRVPPFLPKHFSRSGPGQLLLPTYQRSNPAEADTYPFIGVSIGYTDLFGGAVTSKEVVDRLSVYGIKRVLDVVSRASAVLHHFGFSRQLEAQQIIRNVLFGARAKEINDAIERCFGRNPISGVPFFVLFHELQLVNTAKIALLALPEHDQPDRQLDILGEALLIITDLINNDDREVISGSEPGATERLHNLLVRNTLFNAGDERSHAFARAFDVFLSDKPHLRHHHGYVNLPNVFEQIVGLPVDLYWSMLFATYSHFAALTNNDPGTARGPLNEVGYYSKFVGVSDEQKNLFMSQIGRTVPEHQLALAAKGCTKDRLNPYELLPLEAYPLVRIDGEAYCTSVQLLEKKLINGFYHLFLSRIANAADRDKYLTYLGHVFADYIRRIFERAYPAAIGRYIGEEDLAKHARDEVCDGALVCPEALILIECKSTLLPHEVRVEGTGSAYEKRLERIFVKSARQIDATINAVKAGRYLPIGLNPIEIKKYYPIVVLLDNFPFNPLTADQMRGALAKAGVLQGADVMALQSMSIDEFECLEVALQEGRTFQQLIDEKLASPQFRDSSFRNQWTANDEPFLRTRNPYLAGLFDNVLLGFLQKHLPGVKP